ncbi:hypothetical protein HBP99_05670 [Listeria booriae]|uniref:hypothetical protein n=1 Tax=Listeria booriae TaxID=1552123 RepID=UPI0016271E6D|nr:hypothetical protein [Listeria booriae]MBC2368113.1 hypothetical protein [Listeria booriae]
MTKQSREKMPRKTYAYIEHELSNYHRSIEKLDELKTAIIESDKRSIDENAGLGIKSTGGGPLAKTILIDESIRIDRLQTLVAGIGYVVSRLPDTKSEPYCKLIQLRYWEKRRKLTMEGIAEQLHISRRTAFRMKDKVIYAIADSLGEW